MTTRLRSFRALASLAGVAMLLFSTLASADPPSRVARLGYMRGAVSFSPAGQDEWVQASLNRPLTTGDRLWADASARAEVQVGGAMIRMNAQTDVSILNLDDRIAQMQLTQGELNVRVRRLEPDQTLEVDTPNLAFTVRQPGAYRIQVDPDGNATTIVVHNGQGEVYGEGASYLVDSSQPYRFTGTGLREYASVAMPAADDFDRWSSDRDRMYDNSASARYVSPEVTGYQDLDTYGTWRVDATYGNVWVPSRVGPDWSPYHDGHWAWVDPWGWTWVDDAPWGFAVTHYGRWAHVSSGWCWVPGPVQVRPYYAPALVAFVGGPNFQLSISTGAVGGVAWFPLGPREVYRPSYEVSRRYFENVNVSNTVVNTTVINNYYNNTNVTNVVYANRRVPNAVVAVPTAAFTQSQPVARQAVRVSQDKLVNAAVAVAPPVAPTEKSLRGPAAQGNRPPPKVTERSVVARSAPPAERASFEAQKRQLDANPGRPLGDNARKELEPAANAPKPAVKVIAQKEEARPATKLPAPAPAQAQKATPRPQEKQANVQEGKQPQREAPSAPKPNEPAQAARPPERQASVQEGKQPQREAPSAAKPNEPAQAARPPERQANVREGKQPPREAPSAPKPNAPAQAPRPPEQRANVQEGKQPQREVPPAVKPNAPAAVPRPPEQQARVPQGKPPEREAPSAAKPNAPGEVARPPAARPPQERARPEQREEQPAQSAARPPAPAPAPQARSDQRREAAPRPPAVEPPQRESAARPEQPHRPVAEARPAQQPKPPPNAQPREQQRTAPSKSDEKKKEEQ